MASAGEIQAGRAAISVVLDDTGIQPQMQALSARLKAASAGLSAATMPAMAESAAGPAREYAARLAEIDAQNRKGLISGRNYREALAQVGQQLAANATPAQALGMRFVELDRELAKGKISQDEYRTKSQQLAQQFLATAGPVDKLQGHMVALERDVRTGAISEAEYKRELSALHREFTAAATPADQFAAEIATLDAQLKQGTISQEQHTEATKRAKQALDQSENAAQKKAGAMQKLGGQLTTLAAGYISWTAILNTAGQALEYVRGETEKAKNSQDALVDSRRRLAQVATSEEDLAAMLERADKAAMKFGVSRQKAQEAIFSARSEGWEAEYETVMRNATVVDPNAAAGVAGQVPGLFRATGEQISTEQAVSGTLAAAQQSRLDFESIARSLPQAAEGVSQAKGTFAETASALGVLAGRFKSGDTAAERIKLFSAKLAQNTDTAGRGLIGGFDALVAAGAEAQKEFLGESVELNAAFTILSEEMPLIKQRTAELADELARTAKGEESLLARQRRIAEADPGEQARLERMRAAIERERANERQFATAGSLRQAAADRTIANIKATGGDGFEQFAAERAAGAGDFFQMGTSATTGMMRGLVAAMNPGRAFNLAMDAEKQAELLRSESAALREKTRAESPAFRGAGADPVAKSQLDTLKEIATASQATADKMDELAAKEVRIP
jgi:chromosome segregation ATPase